MSTILDAGVVMPEWLGTAGIVTAIVTSVGALVVSIVAYRRTSAQQERLVAIEEKRERESDLEREKAKVIVEISRGGSATKLTFQNVGNAIARDLEITADGKPVVELPNYVDAGSPIPAVLSSGARFTRMIVFHTGVPFEFALRIMWNDDSGGPGCFETTVSAIDG